MKKEFSYTCVGGVGIRVHLMCATSPILWNKEGLFGLISLAKIHNALKHFKDLHQDPELLPVIDFYWQDVIPVSSQIANALLGEDKDDKCVYKDKNEN